MWKDFKKKWMDWFQEDEANETDEAPTPRQPKHERHETNAKTKMTYKYPKQGEFRFPVIPDQAPKRRRQSLDFQPEQEEQPPRKRREKRTEEVQQEQQVSPEQPEERELPEISSIPFTPTDVPSPIYGYNPREVKTRVEELEEVVEEKQEEEPVVNNDDQEWEMLRARLRDRMSARRDPLSVEEEIPTQQKPAEFETSASDEEGVEESVEHVNTLSDDQEEDTPSNIEISGTDEAAPHLESVTYTEEKQEDVDDSIPVLEETEVHSEPFVEMVEHVQETPVEAEPEPAFPIDEVEKRESEEELESDRIEPVVTHTDELLEETADEDRLVSEEPKDTLAEQEPIQEEPKEEKPKKRSVPFNVIMTPRDKRTRDQHAKPVKNDHKPEPTPAPAEEEEGSEPEEKYERIPYQTPMHLLDDATRSTDEDDTWIEEQMNLLETTLRHFHVKAKVVNAMKGPSVTRFEVQPEPGVKVSKITNLSDDIKLSMAARDIRIEAPIPGKQAVGIEVPNQQSQMVGLQEIFESDSFRKDTSPLSVGLGLDIGGDPIVTNLKKMPHGLIAGATGSGKSVCINTILVSLLYKAHYDDVKFLLIDPKMVELAPYNDLPHLVSPVITDVKAATTALKWAVKEMEERYEKFVEEGVRDVERYNDKMIKQDREDEKLPYLVIVIDELADLMMVSPQDVEDAICRIAQKARACGIHLLLATQRPSVDVITGLIKANIPTRVAFSVSSQVDSRTIIDTSGAEKLLGRGDMLFVENGSGQARRIQGAFVSDDEIERITNHVKRLAPPQYLFHQEELMKQISSEEETDELFEEAVRFVLQHNGASASLIQRRFKVGYNRAARLIDQMEDYGIISEQKGSKPRDILMNEQQIEELMNA
ncbi:DNA translocase FtsK [Halobacillus salinus]|uniref:DNA translocase FtsK n=1 Tax=Halobacillus salinus TaxID=192814 RepID=A0A4Z0H428_9BACI|nr:DNA translocase FtsK [Halobacillus salinus]TGB04026.1 DNA translocase FtsK [Halobacillus salinus]